MIGTACAEVVVVVAADNPVQLSQRTQQAVLEAAAPDETVQIPSSMLFFKESLINALSVMPAFAGMTDKSGLPQGFTWRKHG